MLDKVKGALGLEDEEVDENILEYCSLDPTVSTLQEAQCGCIPPLPLLHLTHKIHIPSADTCDPRCAGHKAEGKDDTW